MEGAEGLPVGAPQFESDGVAPTPWRADHGCLLVAWSMNCFESDSAEKPYECFDDAQHKQKISNDFTRSSVRSEALEG